MLRTLVPSTLWLLVIANALTAADPESIPVIDCHVHLWDISRPEMTWPRKEHTQLYKSFLPQTHAPLCAANGVTGVVVVLSGQALVDNQWNLDITAHNKQLYRALSATYPWPSEQKPSSRSL